MSKKGKKKIQTKESLTQDTILRDFHLPIKQTEAMPKPDSTVPRQQLLHADKYLGQNPNFQL